MNFWYLKTGVQKPPAEWKRPGKVEWPDLVTIRMTKRQAIVHLAALARQLEGRQDDEDFELAITGVLERQPTE